MAIDGTFTGYNTGLSALLAAQAGEDVVGNNIANANTAGYTDETIDFTDAPSFYLQNQTNTVYDGQTGTGVVAQSVQRAGQQYLDAQTDDATSIQSQQNALSTSLQNIQSAFNEPSTSGINETMTQFFSNFTELQTNPADTGVRTTVIAGGQALAQVFQTTQSNLTSAGQQVSEQMSADMTTVNSDATQIASLNVQIRQALAQGQQPNELMDQRQNLIDSLSKLVNVNATNNSDGTMTLSIGTTSLVVGGQANQVSLSSLESNGDLQSGELSGLQQAQTNLAGYQNNLNTLANEVITDVNALQAGGTNSNGVTEPGGMGLDGSTGVAFFTGDNASNIAVNPTLISNPQELAAGAIPSPPATTPAAGDASVATEISQLAYSPSDALGNQSPLAYYRQLISKVGSDTSTANTAESDASAALAQLTNQRNSVEGVNIDQEMTNMLQYQRQYEAAAKVISTQDTMMNDLINGIFGSAGN